MSANTSDLETRLQQGPAGDDYAAAVRAARDAAAKAGEVDVAYTTTDSPVGPLLLAATDEGLCVIEFGARGDSLDDVAEHISPRIVEVPKRLDPVRRQLDQYFAGKRQRFDLDLDRRLMRGFRRTVLERLFDDIGYGELTSYSELAEMAGSPRAMRAVGSAMATNPIPIVVPCHRVLRNDGSIGGYGGGLATKRWLLALEGVEEEIPDTKR
jgi:methylated-DNA-[protein]-cysteine S-methyltransferase